MDEQDIVFVKLDKVLAKLDLMHDEMQQAKGRLAGVEKRVASLVSLIAGQGEAIAAQWDNFDRTAERETALLQAPNKQEG
ncbi:hypothetical protein AWB81_07182 [Caballeronia arationis]|uniref:hypothetical protein n=1 Tax=Caballeronia arationis TaxID=1777142 RepID=UPI00074B63D9|nr:hypothetical protein [Caballeronia arationis]SAL05487.1 hypothetical protein AWB81_07182 [Caballeronia arationis]